MKIKKIIAAVAAAAMSISMLAFNTSAEDIGTFGIYMADEAWAVQYWGGDLTAEGNTGIKSVTNATITGDGTYTASIEFESPMTMGTFFGLCSDIAADGKDAASTFKDYPDAKVVIDSFMADGNAVAGNKEVAQMNDSGLMRINLFNPWADASVNYLPSLDWSAGCSKIDVTFTITGMGGGAAVAEVAPAAETTTAETTAAPAADSTTPSATTGNTAVIAIVAMMAVAGTAVIVTKKRK